MTGWRALRTCEEWAFALTVALGYYYAWADEYACETAFAERPCYWTWDTMNEKTRLEWKRGMK
jgi:hypothetical protein